jgi:hypothetical protein
MSMMNGRVPVLGQQQQQQQIMAIQQVVGCYMSLLPVVASSVLNDKETIVEDPSGRIADQAWKITLAAMKKIGIHVPEVPTEP